MQISLKEEIEWNTFAGNGTDAIADPAHQVSRTESLRLHSCIEGSYGGGWWI